MSTEGPIALELAPPDAPAAARAAAPSHCPICLRPFLPETRICVHCHFDLDRGLDENTWIGSARLGARGLTCAGCGYDLRGLKQLRCPECGETIKPAAIGAAKDDARRVTREVWLTPLLMLAGAGSIVITILLFTQGVAAARSHALGFLVEVPVGLLVYLACCAIWIGFDAPLHLTALRLAGIFAAVDLFLLLGGFVLPWIMLWAAAIVLLAWLLSEQLELELDDAFYLGFAMFFARIGASVLLDYAMA